MFRCTFFVHFYHGKEHRYHHNSMAIAITAKNTETIIIPCYKVLSMDMDFWGSQNCPKSSKAFKTSLQGDPRRFQVPQAGPRQRKTSSTQPQDSPKRF